MKKTQSGGRWKHLCEVTPEFTLLFFFFPDDWNHSRLHGSPFLFQVQTNIVSEKKKILAQIILLTVCFGNTYSTGTWASQVALVVKNSRANAGDKRCGFDPWVRKTSWRRAWQPTTVFLSGESHGQRSLEVYSPWCGRRVRHNWANTQQ